MKQKRILFGLACMSLMVSCADLDYHEYTTYDKNYVFTDFDRTAGVVTDIYSFLDSDIPTDGSLCSACDESEYAWSWSSVFGYTDGRWSPSNPYSRWDFAGIRRANFFLTEYVNADFSELKYDKDYEAEMKRFNRYPYEVRFLRAYFYFNLARAYGDVPLITKVLTEDEANQVTRTPVAEVFDFIVKECDAILEADQLPVRYSDLVGDAANGSSTDGGRVTKQAVMALKARTLLYWASPLFNKENNSGLWRQAAQANKDVIDFCTANGISLGKYSEIWGTNNWQAGEMIFVRRVGDMNWPETTNFPVGMENGNSGNCPTQTLIDAYEMQATGLAWDEPGSGYDQTDPYAGRDPRLAMTIAVNGDKWPDTNPNPLETYQGGRNGLPLAGATPTGYYLKKYLDKTIDISTSTGSGSTRHNWVTYRLGEFYLNYAEAVFNYLGSADATDGTFTMSAVDAVNVVRSRSDVNMPGFPTGLSNDEFTEKYRRERMVELAFEGHRFWDVRRWKDGASQRSIIEMQITKNGDRYTYNRVPKSRYWDDKMYLFPIPDSEIRKNPNLTQNPGW
ncbi:RagB/SusD family nutrient uptake outer membrane protein [Bacteroides gallinaceum]|uniref:RagB/SusD family nutrient uptake outer membrane protein n=2 Tax=Bacteroidaceae TaxID=815 RepID=A0ABT7VCA4_9BACE|nr:RagB/SusD family nutrient uptake outer membrane protein [Bacteroides gallinaceum]MBU3856441.1 RagB/SusD family nutrient uptake outer membrane protein [Candidatus Phocaeicola excrementipullorum]MBW9198467.1 RagB/SusD family nutrient uptake outer membrane protein [Bacteroidales bacterium SW299]MDM8323926.1 RagB/SusD family nutrient uptake outer membrane protein [Bacteroides gallinaceum]